MLFGHRSGSSVKISKKGGLWTELSRCYGELLSTSGYKPGITRFFSTPHTHLAIYTLY
jgi:hypothetical protein